MSKNDELNNDCATARSIMEGDKEKVTSPVFNEDNPFLLPTILEGKPLKSKILKILGLPITTKKQMYLWNRLSDPLLHKNDYISIENPIKDNLTELVEANRNSLEGFPNGSLAIGSIAELESALRMEFKWLLSACNGAFLIERLIPELGEVDLIDMSSLGAIENIPVQKMKLKHVVETFRSLHCADKCKSPYFFVGEGQYVVGEEIYSGIHVVRYPSDELSKKFWEEEYNLPGIEMKRINYVLALKQELESILKM